MVAGGGSDVGGRGRRPVKTLSCCRWKSDSGCARVAVDATICRILRLVSAQLCDTSRTGFLLLEGPADREAGEQGRSRMASNGIRDRVAIVGMGCTPFGEHWDKGVSDLLVDATKEALGSAGIELPHVDAFWVGTLYSGQSGLTLSRPLKIDYKPVSRIENYCATGSEAFRNACYAVASGAYDVAMAIGVEKLKDSGFSGLPGSGSVGDGTRAPLHAQATFSLLAPAYAKKFGVDERQFKDVITRIAWKNHKNGALNPRAQFRKEVSKETIDCSPIVAGALGIFDCSGVRDRSPPALRDR